MPTTTRIAAAQIDSRLGRVDTNLAKILARTADAGANGADLVVFPECALTGYQFGSREEALKAAQSVPGPATDALSSVCAELGTHAIFGMLELQGANLYNTAVLIGPDGFAFKYHKNHIPFQGVDRYVDRGDLPFQLCDAGDLHIGLQICYDIFFPESSRVHSLLGADIITLPTNFATMGVVERAGFIINTRAIENKVYVLCCNRVGEERGYPFCGRSKIVDPMGVTMAEASTDCEEIIYADIDPGNARTKRITHSAGEWEIDRMADRRPELYGIITQPTQKSP
ncbi:MAG: carbon-nitrogen hydrolase family protein [Dehalococcoidia bacterium]|nr:carbon-nitrogen hydrolase family protein [Dehalococcoidia bacterium]